MKKSLLTLLAMVSLAGTTWSQTSPDNTATNARDRHSEQPTAGDQSNAPADLKISAETRKLVIADKSLSTLAKNAKIITIDGVVTLRGPVKSTEEKSALAAFAKQAGAKKVVNELEIKNS